eukprot:jgi/Botrbrau1/13578/Bobra.0307s0002.2
MEDELSLEEELLQVAGRNRSGGKKRRRVASESDEEGQVHEDSGEYDDDVGPSTKSKSRRRSPTEEEGVGSDITDYGDGYGSDLMGDEEDRAKLMAMNELDREMILAERSEARDREREQRKTSQLLKQRQREMDQAAQMRSSTRMKSSDTAKKSAMAELIAAKARRKKPQGSKSRRKKDQDEDGWSEQDEDLSGSESAMSDKSSLPKSEQAEDVGQRGRTEDGRGHRSSPSRYLSEDEEDDDGRERFPEREEAEEADFGEAKQIQILRKTLVKWWNQPYFERTLPGTLVKLSVKGFYMIAEVEGVIEQEPGTYRCPGANVESPYLLEGKFETNKWLQVVRGNSRQTMPMIWVSNQDMLDEEWESWQKQCRKDNRAQLSRADVKEVAKKIGQANSYVYTSEDVKKIVEEKRAKGEVRNAALEKARLIQLREAARGKGDIEEESRLSQLIATLDARLQQKGQNSRLYGMAHINARNKQRNFENALHNVGARPEGSKTLTADGVDPFSRRRTRPQVYWSTKKHNSAQLSVETTTVVPNLEEDLEPETPNATATATENADGGLDLNIDISVLGIVPKDVLIGRKLLGRRWQLALSPLAVPTDLGSKKLLTLTDYKRRQGIA